MVVSEEKKKGLEEFVGEEVDQEDCPTVCVRYVVVDHFVNGLGCGLNGYLFVDE